MVKFVSLIILSDCV